EENITYLTEIRQILWTNRKPVAPVNQVWPNLYIGDESVASVSYFDNSGKTNYFVKVYIQYLSMYLPGKVFVHCAMGVSRSGHLICHGLSSAEAIIAVRLNRDIGPNSGFLAQLELSVSLQSRQITEERADTS
ncbi:dual specificity phosphatase 29-like, partial [Perca fluviatilis]|uniref:dual specificity phosphatase 29-like n=1 Tax=Perca fluviatilis TaxID=8168 RepID=UPI0019630E8C